MITMTDTAVSKVKELIAAQNREGSGLRVYVAGGGCSGFRYGMDASASGSPFWHELPEQDTRAGRAPGCKGVGRSMWQVIVAAIIRRSWSFGIMIPFLAIERIDGGHPRHGLLSGGNKGGGRENANHKRQFHLNIDPSYQSYVY